MHAIAGQMYRRNRYSDPQTGQFTQEAPLGLAGGMNAYGFGNGDPINFTDPFGLWPDPSWSVGLRVGIGVAVRIALGTAAVGANTFGQRGYLSKETAEQVERSGLHEIDAEMLETAKEKGIRIESADPPGPGAPTVGTAGGAESAAEAGEGTLTAVGVGSDGTATAAALGAGALAGVFAVPLVPGHLGMDTPCGKAHCVSVPEKKKILSVPAVQADATAVSPH